MSEHEGQKRLAEAIAIAASLVKSLPQELRTAAFAKALDVLLDSTESVFIKSPPATTTIRSKRSDEPGVTALEILERNIDRTAFPEIHSARTTLHRSLLVLRAARVAGGVEWLSPADITALLKQKFRLPDKPSAVRMALSRAHRLVDRRTAVGTPEYRLMAPGEQYLAERDASAIEASSPRSDKPTLRTKSKKTALTQAVGTKLGPTRMLEQLLHAGFFGTGRTLSDIIEHLSLKKARRFKSTDVSPALTRMVRAGKVDRESGADGYLYKEHEGHRRTDPFLEGISKSSDGR